MRAHAFFVRNPHRPTPKVFASAVELIATAYLSWLIFGIPVDGYTFIALILIVAASSIYSMSPIKAPAASTLPT